MTVPAYHLRPNKAIDRFALMEAIRRLARLGGKGLGRYTYYGLGGPYLEDFRLLYELYPKIRMVSIEEDKETLKRQEFHRPCSSLQLEPKNLSSFITSYNPGNAKSIFWLDYTRLERDCFDDFQHILGGMAPGSMIKVTLPSDPDKLFLAPDKRRSPELIDEFHEKFVDFMPNTSANLPRDPKCFADLMQDMTQIAAQQALPTTYKGRKFIPVSSFRYSDGTQMFTLTGVVCRENMEGKLKKVFKDWEHANLTWKPPKLIDMPILSTKERLLFQSVLPAKKSGRTLRKILGYRIDNKPGRTEEALKQYATFHRYAPYFLKGIP